MNYVLNDSKMFADVTDGIAIIINSETGIYYGLNGLGTAVYENLIDLTTDPDVIGPLLWLRQREIVHFNRFEELFEYYEKMLNNNTSSSNQNMNINNSSQTNSNSMNFNSQNNATLEQLLMNSNFSDISQGIMRD